MPLHPPFDEPERILLTGAHGSGKSTSWLTIAQWALRTQSDARFMVVDTDRTVNRLLHTEFPECRENVEYKLCFKWEEVKAALTEYSGKARPQDWIIIDMVTPCWDMVQDWYAKMVHGKDRSGHFVEVRAAQQKEKDKGRNTSASSFDGMSEWPIIKGEYNDCLIQVLLRGNCNTLVTASIDSLSSMEKDRAIMSIFGPYAIKPRGEKNTSHMFHTVLWTSAPVPKQVHMTTIKDRGRPNWTGERLSDFTREYLVSSAEWSLT